MVYRLFIYRLSIVIMKKGYTIVELIIVIGIIWVLMVAFRNVFQVNNKDTLYGEACVNNLYGDVSNYLYSAITSKAIYDWSGRIYPDSYYIEFSSSTNAIILRYQTWENEIITGRYLSLTWTVPQNYNCSNNKYDVILSGGDLILKINKWLTEDNDLRSMTLSGGANLFTGTIKFYLTYPLWNNGNKELGKFDIDIRTQNIKKTICLDINNSWTCSE